MSHGSLLVRYCPLWLLFVSVMCFMYDFGYFALCRLCGGVGSFGVFLFVCFVATCLDGAVCFLLLVSVVVLILWVYWCGDFCGGVLFVLSVWFHLSLCRLFSLGVMVGFVWRLFGWLWCWVGWFILLRMLWLYWDDFRDGRASGFVSSETGSKLE